MILILNASPRRHGNISQMVEVMADECRQAGVEVQMVTVQQLDIRPCLGCMKCRAAHKCVLPEDDAQRVLKLIQQADALVIAAPCYWGNIPGTL
ncbi:MAG: flavodoxin family protein, partial [Prevotella sp.]|nr:flavodoxin family protein [Prevotella sp.]